MEELYDIYDPDENSYLRVLLSVEDYERAKNDSYFANSLMKKAKLTLPNQENLLQSADSNKLISQNKTASETNSSNTLWSYEHTTNLIKSMENHMDDFNHSIKRKNVFQNVSNDMLSSGYTVDINAIKSKWKGLTRSYNTAKDNKNIERKRLELPGEYLKRP